MVELLTKELWSIKRGTVLKHVWPSIVMKDSAAESEAFSWTTNV